MRLEITPNFITQEECALLNAWAYEGVVKKWLDVGISSGKLINKRLTSRLYGDRFEYPKEVIELSTKIRSFVGISNYSIIEGHGNRGVVVSFSKPGSDVYKHKDPKKAGLSALRCNIITQLILSITLQKLKVIHPEYCGCLVLMYPKKTGKME